MKKTLTGLVGLTSPPTQVAFGGAVANLPKTRPDASLISMFLGSLMTRAQ